MEDKSIIVCKGTPNKSGLECLVIVKLKTGATTVAIAKYVEELTEEAYYFSGKAEYNDKDTDRDSEGVAYMKEGWYEMPLYGSLEVVSRMDEEVVGWIQVSSLLQYLLGVGK